MTEAERSGYRRRFRWSRGGDSSSSGRLQDRDLRNATWPAGHVYRDQRIHFRRGSDGHYRSRLPAGAFQPGRQIHGGLRGIVARSIRSIGSFGRMATGLITPPMLGHLKIKFGRNRLLTSRVINSFWPTRRKCFTKAMRSWSMSRFSVFGACFPLRHS